MGSQLAVCTHAAGSLIIAVKARGVIRVACVKCQADSLQHGQAGKHVMENWRLKWRPDAKNLQASEGTQTTDARLHRTVGKRQQLPLQSPLPLSMLQIKSKHASGVLGWLLYQGFDTDGVPCCSHPSQKCQYTQVLQLSRRGCRVQQGAFHRLSVPAPHLHRCTSWLYGRSSGGQAHSSGRSNWKSACTTRTLARKVSARILGLRCCSHFTMLPACGVLSTCLSARGCTSTTDHMLASAMILCHRAQASGTFVILDHQTQPLPHRIRNPPGTRRCRPSEALSVQRMAYSPIFPRQKDVDFAEHVIAKRV